MRENLRFMGRMTAGMTHEINNVLAVIRETAGLAQDLAALDVSKASPHGERIIECLQEVQRQIERGAAVTRGLNRFAHSVDHDRETRPVQDLLDLAASLHDRFVRQHQVVLGVSRTPGAASLDADPFLVIEVLSRLIFQALADLGAGKGRVRISADPADTGRPKAVRVWFEDQAADSAPAGSGPAAESGVDPAADLAPAMASSGLSVRPVSGSRAGGWLLCW